MWPTGTSLDRRQNLPITRKVLLSASWAGMAGRLGLAGIRGLSCMWLGFSQHSSWRERETETGGKRESKASSGPYREVPPPLHPQCYSVPFYGLQMCH